MDTASERYDNTGVDLLYSTVWGDDIHYGYYDTPEEQIGTATRRAKHIMAERAELSAATRVLEVGCGYGTTARYIAEHFSAPVLATNISRSQLERATRETAHSPAKERVNFEWADFHDLPYEDAAFDRWWCQESLVHSADKPRVLGEAWRVLKPGGYAVISDQIFRPDKLSKDELEAVRARYETETVLGPEDYADMIRDAGFELTVFEDWQEHAEIHRRRVRDRLVEIMPSLRGRVDEETLQETCRVWSRWADIAAEGKLTVGFYVARKP